MALDTALKRTSAVHPGSPWRGRLPLPDGTIGSADRQTNAWLYAGIVTSERSGYYAFYLVPISDPNASAMRIYLGV